MSEELHKRQWRMFASMDEEGHFQDVFSHPRQVRNCGGEPIPVVVELLDAESSGSQVGWLDKEDNLSLIFPTRRMLELCFTYSIAYAIDKGEGTVVHLRILTAPAE